MVVIQNLQGSNSGTPLYAASKADHLEIVRLFLDKGANVNSDSQTMLRANAELKYSCTVIGLIIFIN